MSYDKEAISQKFGRGKNLLDNGHYASAILIFSELIDQSTLFKDTDDDARVTWHTSLNNRGVARCRKGHSERDKQLFEEGVRDLQTAVDSEPNDQERPGLVASGNLKYASQLLGEFDKIDPVDFRTF